MTAGSASETCGGLSLAALEGRLLGKAKKSGDAAATRRPVSARWTPADDEWLLNLAGYEPVKRSPSA